MYSLIGSYGSGILAVPKLLFDCAHEHHLARLGTGTIKLITIIIINTITNNNNIKSNNNSHFSLFFINQTQVYNISGKAQ